MNKWQRHAGLGRKNILNALRYPDQGMQNYKALNNGSIFEVGPDRHPLTIIDHTEADPVLIEIPSPSRNFGGIAVTGIPNIVHVDANIAAQSTESSVALQ